jgi:hypothetical protein
VTPEGFEYGIPYQNEEGFIVKGTVKAGEEETRMAELRHSFPYINRIVLERRGRGRASIRLGEGSNHEREETNETRRQSWSEQN